MKDLLGAILIHLLIAVLLGMVSNKTNFLGNMTTPVVAIIGRPNVGKSTF